MQLESRSRIRSNSKFSREDLVVWVHDPDFSPPLRVAFSGVRVMTIHIKNKTFFILIYLNFYDTQNTAEGAFHGGGESLRSSTSEEHGLR